MENEELIKKITELEKESDKIAQQALKTWNSTQWHKDKYGNFEIDPRQAADYARKLADMTFDHQLEISELKDQVKKEAKAETL